MEIAIPVATSASVLAFAFGFTWWNPRWRFVTVFGLVFLVLLPPDAHALGLIRVSRWLGISQSSSVLLFVSDLAWSLPFATGAVFASNSLVEPILFEAAREMGASRTVIARRVLLPLTWPGVFSAGLIGLLLTFNDYTRASYLSGPRETISQYVWSKMRSGADPTVYAIGVLDILFALIVIAAVGCCWG
jgi:spermidine/putrescine transport system permease protein